MVKAITASILLLVPGTWGLTGEHAAPDKEMRPDFETLELKDGTVLEQCFVTRVETEGLIVRHTKGMAHVSFFDLDNETQEKYGFDPVAAMAAYKERLEKERNLRKEEVLKSARRNAEEERRLAEEARYELAQEEWIPCEALVVQSTTSGSYVFAKQIVLYPTEVQSTLGFVRPGPPKRKLKRFGLGMIFLKNIEPIPVAGSSWQGYINPVTATMAPDPDTGEETIPIHSAISKRP